MLTVLKTIGWFFKRVWWFCRDNWKVVLPVIAILVIGIFVYRSCNKPPKLNEAEIQKGEQAVKERNDKVLRDILANSDVREQAIDDSIKAAEDAKEKAKRSYEHLTTDELAAELERRKNQ